MKSYPHLRLGKPVVLKGPIEFLVEAEPENEAYYYPNPEEPPAEPENQSYYYPNPKEEASAYFIAVLTSKYGKQYRVFDTMRRFVYASTLRSDAEQYVDTHIKARAERGHRNLRNWVKALTAETADQN